MTKKRSVVKAPVTMTTPLTEAEVVQAYVAAHSPTDASVDDPGALQRSARADRHIGITIVFTTDEHATLRFLSKWRGTTYSHTLRSLIAEECTRLWPKGISRELLNSTARSENAERSEKKRRTREKEAERLRKVSNDARERQLVIEEELRRMTNQKRQPAKPRPVHEPDVPASPPPTSTNPAVAAWYAKRAAQLEHGRAVRADSKPRVRSKA